MTITLYGQGTYLTTFLGSNGSIKKNQIIASGTPQFDFHFDKNFEWTKEKLYRELNLDIKKNIILYTTGMASDFPGEHKFIETLIDHIKKNNNRLNSQLVIRLI